MMVEVPRDRIGDVIAVLCQNVGIWASPRENVGSTGKEGRRKQTCGKCGKTGHRRDRCTGGSKEKDDTEQLSRSQYDAVREHVKNGMTSKDAAHEGQISVREANLACQYPTYEKYVKGR